MNKKFNLSDCQRPNDITTGSFIQVIKVKANTGTLSPAQRRFNKLISRLDNLHREIQSFEKMLHQHRMPFLQRITEIESNINQCRRKMLLFLHDRRQGQDLTASEKKIAAEMIKLFFEFIDQAGDDLLESIFDIYHSPKKLAQQEAKDALIKKEFLDLVQSITGRPLEGFDTAQSPAEMMAIFMAHLDAIENPMEAEKNHAKTSARKSPKKASPRMLKKQKAEEDAHATMRIIFRQLASALHPDREPDPAERERKTTLMSQANAAYERRDLGALLRLQMQISQIDEKSMAQLTDDKLNAMSTLLQEQISALEQSKIQAEYQATHEFGFQVFPGLSETALLCEIRSQTEDYQEELAALQSEIVLVQDPKYLKQWLKNQKNFLQSRSQARILE